MILNFEPVVILLMAAVIVGEEITLPRSVGLALVLPALVLSRWPVLQKQRGKVDTVQNS